MNSRNSIFLVLAGLAGLAIIFAVGGFGSGNSSETAALQGIINTETQDPIIEFEKIDITVGTGSVAEAGNVVRLHYVGTLINGTLFDSSRDRGEPFEFTLGAGQVIPGFDDGVIGMQVGGTRTIVIPPSLAYGESGDHPLAGQTLQFEVELLEIK
jgi:FKBP-type peptidyl-prolyl cis-trans isomerase FkpA